MIVTTTLLLACAAPALPQDRLTLLSGERIGGAVQSATLEEVQYQDGAGQTQTLEGRQILSIEFGRLPALIAQAEKYLADQDYQNAVNTFDGAVAAGQGPPWAATYAALGKAKALLAWAQVDPGRASEAATAFQNWVATHPDHFHVLEARTGLAQALALSGKVDEAARNLEELATFAFNKNLSKHVEFTAQVDRCEVYLIGKQAQVAETRLRDLIPQLQGAIGNRETPMGVRGLLRSLLSRSQILLGDALEGRQGSAAVRPYWESLLKDPTVSPDVRAAASLGLALAARAAGKAREAQLLMARVVATLPANSPVLPRALYYLGELSQELKNVPVDGRIYFERVIQDYPSSTWAQQAREKLGQ
ncbi:MAG: hypothetical protein DWQ01_13865 [Planctomycetota bacterium]|nr:MAG: hypothetical protein DWQ01_13865 [Planctomycetota bacterium]